MRFTPSPRLSVITLAAVAALSACGGGDDVVMSDRNFATPTVRIASADQVIDLRNYAQVGRYALPAPATDSVNATDTNLLAEEASAITYNWDTDTLFVVGDGGTAVVQVDKQGDYIDSATFAQDASKPQGTYIYDPEGLLYLGNGQFAVVEERYRQVSRFTYTAGADLGEGDFETVDLGTDIGNIGYEGMGWDPMTQGLVGVKEASPQAVFTTTVDFGAGTASNGSATTELPENVFDPSKAGLSAINDVFALSNVLKASDADHGDLLLLSAPDGLVRKMSREGVLHSSLNVGAAAQNEGMVMDSDGVLYVVGEVGGGDGKPEMVVFANQCEAPSSGHNICLAFDQDIQLGNGNVTLDNGAGDRQVFNVQGSAVRADGHHLIVHTDSMVAGTDYQVTFSQDAVRDISGGAAPAYSGSDLQVNTAAVKDVKAPSLSSSAPEAGATNVASSALVLTFDEPVTSGSGQLELARDTGSPVSIDINDSSQVYIAGNSVTITPADGLLPGSSYTLTMAAGVLQDLSGNAFAGFTGTDFSFEIAEPSAPQLLVTEANSNATGGDFFELYNFGRDAVDLTGWRYNDAAAQFSTAIAFPDNTTIQPGEVLLVHVGAETTAEFLQAWGLPADTAAITLSSEAPTDAPKLGSGDAVVIYEDSGAIAAVFNYTGLDPIGDVASLTANEGEHAGETMGANKKASAVWDGVSTSAPNYRAPATTDLGYVAQDADNIGSPGAVQPAPSSDVIITELNSNSGGGDFIELTNKGAASVNISNWVYDDDSASYDAAATENVKLPPNLMLQPNERMVVVVKVADDTDFRANWAVAEGVRTAVLPTGAGMGKGDAAVFFDANGRFVVGLNYGASALTVCEQGQTAAACTIDLAPVQSSGGVSPTETLHAGPSLGGGADNISLVWDEASEDKVTFLPADNASAPATVQTAADGAKGSPGQ